MEPAEAQSEAMEYVGALKPLRYLKALAWLVVFLALATQVTCFAFAQFSDKLGRLTYIASAGSAKPTSSTQPAAQSQPAAPSQPSAELAATKPALAAAEPGAIVDRTWVAPAISAMTAGRFAAPLAAFLLVVLIFLSLQVSLVGRLGGARGFSSSLVWSILLLAATIPWEQVLPISRIPNVLCDFFEMQAAITRTWGDWQAGCYYTPEMVAHFARFLLAPFIMLLLWVLVAVRFAQGMKAVNEATTLPAPRRPEAA